jgi:integrase
VKHLRTADEVAELLHVPVSWVYSKMPEKTTKRDPTFLEVGEVKKLVGVGLEPIATMALLAVMTGMRVGEITALRWGRVNLDRGVLLVAETCHGGHFGSPKTKASRREIPLAEVVLEALRRRDVAGRKDSDFVFTHKPGWQFGYTVLRAALLDACDVAGILRIGWHVLRHTHGTLLHAQGTSLKVAQAQLGHAAMTTTLDVYTHVPSGAQREAVEKLEDVLFPSVPKTQDELSAKSC